MTTRRATSLRPGQFKHLIRVASVTGRQPERDVMLLWLTHTTGIRVTELAYGALAGVCALFANAAIQTSIGVALGIAAGVWIKAPKLFKI